MKKFILINGLRLIIAANATALGMDLHDNWDAPISEIKYSEIAKIALLAAAIHIYNNTDK